MSERAVTITIAVTGLEPSTRRMYRMLRTDVGLSREEASFALLGFSNEITRMINVGRALHDALRHIAEEPDAEHD